VINSVLNAQGSIYLIKFTLLVTQDPPFGQEMLYTVQSLFFALCHVFSAVYWMGYEMFKSKFSDPGFVASFSSGVMSGAVSAHIYSVSIVKTWQKECTSNKTATMVPSLTRDDTTLE